MDFSFLERVLKSVNASIYILLLDTLEVEWVNNSLPFLAKTTTDNELSLNPDFQKNLSDVRDYFLQNHQKRRYQIFKMKRRDETYSWVLTTAVVFEKNLKGIPQKAIATALDVTELINSNDSLSVALGEIQRDKHKDLLNRLTKREMEIIQLLTQGLNIKEIAAKLQRSAHTIETHRGNIKNKLGCKHVNEIPRIGEMIGFVN